MMVRFSTSPRLGSGESRSTRSQGSLGRDPADDPLLLPPPDEGGRRADDRRIRPFHHVFRAEAQPEVELAPQGRP